MEAKDTVIKVSPSLAGTTTDLLEEQAEISFKAGIREVVEWIIRANKSEDFYYSFNQADLQTKLKEWEVKL